MFRWHTSLKSILRTKQPPYFLLVLALAVVGLLAAQSRFLAQPAAPTPPAQYKVELRYAIDSPRDQRVIFYKEMIDGLKKLGFVFNPTLKDLPPTEPENTYKNRIKGTVAGKNGIKIANVPFVASVLLVPADFALPKKQGARVLVDLELTSGFSAGQQRELQDQVRALLRVFGFQESAGYDHRGYTGQPFTRLRGSVPSDVLDILLKDLRTQPTGWFAPKIPPSALPVPLAKVNPIRIIRVLPDPAPVSSLPAPPDRGEEAFYSIGPRLWEIVKANGPQTKPVRVEVIFKFKPKESDSLRILLQKTAPAFVIEGMVGNTVFGVFGRPTVDANGKVVTPPIMVGEEIKALARLDVISSLRIARPATVAVDPTVTFPANNSLAVEKSGLNKLHQKGHRGKGVKIAIIDSDFSGYEEFIKKGKLPKNTHLLDLTIERNGNLLPDPWPTAAGATGHGTQCAAAAALAAPEAEVVLVRIDPAAPHMLLQVLKSIPGELTFSANLTRRIDETRAAGSLLEQRRKQLLIERRHVMESFNDEEVDKQTYKFLGRPIRSWLFTPREWHEQRMQEFMKEYRRQREKEIRLTQYIKSLGFLNGVDIISSSLVWNDGYPLGGRSDLTQQLDDMLRPKPTPVFPHDQPGILPPKQKQPPLWFQSAGNTRGQSWHDAFRDADSNGVLEFRDSTSKLPPGSWTRELNFLSWLPYNKEELVDLPAGTKLRASLQWTEPHAPAYFFQPGEKDWYRYPLAELKLIVLRQRDPAGKELPADAFEVVAESEPLPERLANSPHAATYEIHAEWKADKPGRYAIRIERQLPSRWIVVDDPDSEGLRFVHLTGLAPVGITPLGAPNLPALEPRWQLEQRLFVEAVSGDAARKGRPILGLFTNEGSVGVPADGRDLMAVGAARFDGKAEIFSSMGPPAGLELFLTPRLFSYDRLGGQKNVQGPAFGTSLSAPFAAGMAASVLSAGSPEQTRRWLQQTPLERRVFKIPQS